MFSPEDETYRTCEECGGDCTPEILGAEGESSRFVFVCPEHGVQSVINPFE